MVSHPTLRAMRINSAMSEAFRFLFYVFNNNDLEYIPSLYFLFRMINDQLISLSVTQWFPVRLASGGLWSDLHCSKYSLNFH